MKKPPFTITPFVLNLCSDIAAFLGKYEGLHVAKPEPKLRRHNRIKTIQASLAIEGNTLDLDQVTAILDGKKVVGPKKDVLEVVNAIKAYENVATYKVTSETAFRAAHGLFMKSLVVDAGKYRSGNVGILKGNQVVHVAPKAAFVPRLMADLFQFLKTDHETHALIKACVFHYELEFIHPFQDGNGRMGRLWQTALLAHFHPIFEFVPAESVIRARQKEYYRALEKSDKAGDATAFLEFSLAVIKDAVEEFYAELKPGVQTVDDRLNAAKSHFGRESFSRRDYLALFKTLSTATASRDLALGVRKKMLHKAGEKALTRYEFV